MKNIKNFSTLQKGFTLLEMLLVFTVMGILTFSGMYSFFSYNRSQAIKTSTAEVVNYLNLAKSRSLSNVKPAVCAGQQLKFYEIYMIAPGSTYRLRAMCGLTLYTLESKTLPAGATFTATLPVSVQFPASTGTVVNPQTIQIRANGTNATVSVSKTGVISVL